MCTMAMLRKVYNSKILVVEADSAKAESRTEVLKSKGALAVEVVAYDWLALTRLGKTDHGYNFVSLEGDLFSPEEIREVVLEQEFFERDVN